MLQITFRHMTSTDSLRSVAEEKFEKLRGYYREPVRCHLVIDSSSGSAARKGAAFTAHAELLPSAGDARLDATATHEQAATAVRRAFEHLERQLASRHGRTENTSLKTG